MDDTNADATIHRAKEVLIGLRAENGGPLKLTQEDIDLALEHYRNVHLAFRSMQGQPGAQVALATAILFDSGVLLHAVDPLYWQMMVMRVTNALVEK